MEAAKFIFSVFILFIPFNTGTAVWNKAWCYQCVSSQPGCGAELNWLWQWTKVCPEEDDVCVKILEYKDGETVITRDCLSSMRGIRTDIPADHYEGCRPATVDVKLANYVNNSIKELDIYSVDNSDYMRNGDFLPTRLQAQQDAVNLVCHSKTRSNPENNVGLLTLAKVEVLATLTSDVGRILSKLHQVQPNGDINLQTGIRIAHLALKHRQGKNHKMRIVAFVGSPVANEEKELVKLAKKLKKEKVNVDIVSFGEDGENSTVLTTFISTLNGKDGSSSHLVTVPPGPHLSDALISSPIIQGEDGTGAAGLGTSGFEFGVDPNEDPELALALRVSMEEQRQRQEDEARRAREAAGTGTNVTTEPIKEEPSEEAMLERALAMSMEDGTPPVSAAPRMPVDFANMTEDEQIAFAMQMSMQDAQETAPAKEEPMEVEGDDDEDYSAVMNDPTFLQSVLESLPGVDPQSEAVRQAVGSLKDKKKDEKPDDKQKK